MILILLNDTYFKIEGKVEYLTVVENCMYILCKWSKLNRLYHGIMNMTPLISLEIILVIELELNMLITLFLG